MGGSSACSPVTWQRMATGDFPLCINTDRFTQWTQGQQPSFCGTSLFLRETKGHQRYVNCLAIWVEDLLLEDHVEGENKVGSGCG